MFNFKKADYNRTKLADTWSQHSYQKYKTASNTWLWRQLPNFDLNQKIINKPLNKVSGSILEVGSAAGGAYNFLSNSNILSENIDYTGVDISNTGTNFCKENYPKAKWIQSDISMNKIDKEYDYIFERISVHHMQNPLEILENLKNQTKKSLATSFVSCVNGSTISDLDVARYRHSSGEFVYFNIINIFEVFEIFFSKFNLIHFYYGGPHEKTFSDPMAHQYLSPDININERRIGRCSIIASKIDNLEQKKVVFLNTTNILKKTIKNLLGSFMNKYRDDFSIIMRRTNNFLRRDKNTTDYNWD